MKNNEYYRITSQINRLYNSSEENDRNEYWHYTSLNSILAMFKGYIDSVDSKNFYAKKCTMYASNARYMNDPEEFLDGMNWYTKLSNHNKGVINFNYSLISFSNKGDNLDHWKYYGKDVGVSLCFDMDKIETNVFKEDESKEVKYDKNNRPLKVHYEDDEKRAYYSTLLEWRDKGQLKADSISALFVPFCKEVSFSDESENRMVFFDTINSDFVYNTSNPQKVKPAINVKFRLKEKSASEPFLKNLDVDVPKDKDNIISRIVVGPGDSQELVFNTLIHVFDRAHYKYIEVPQRPSKIVSIEENQLKVGKHGWIVCEMDQKQRFAYRCHNGILIMISAISFRA